MALPAVQGLWIGERLSSMEQLAIRSFLDAGHAVHLYAYARPAGVPPETELRDAAEILPAAEVFFYRRGRGRGSPAGFADLFRYKLLLERGGWWIDLDAICLRPLEFPEEHVAGFERERDGSWHVANGLLKAPPGSPLMRACWEAGRRVDRARTRWGETGPRLLARALQETRTVVRLLPPDAFYPVDHFRFEQLLAAGPLPAGSWSLHLWHSCWRRAGVDPDASFDPASLYEQLRRRHGVRPSPQAASGEGGPRPRSSPLLRRFAAGARRALAWRTCAPKQRRGVAATAANSPVPRKPG